MAATQDLKMFIQAVSSSSINCLLQINNTSNVIFKRCCGLTKWNLCLPDGSNQNFIMVVSELSYRGGRKKKAFLFPEPLRFHQTSRSSRRLPGPVICLVSKLQFGQASSRCRERFQADGIQSEAPVLFQPLCSPLGAMYAWAPLALSTQALEWESLIKYLQNPKLLSLPQTVTAAPCPGTTAWQSRVSLSAWLFTFSYVAVEETGFL